MAPSASLLFHPKVKKEPKREILDTPLPLRRSRAPTARPSPKAEPDDVKPALPEGPFQEFKLMSCDRGGWRYDVMKFDARRPVDIQTWQRPVKVNRKELRRDAPESELAAAQAVGPMLGPDGNPVVGADGRMVMVDADGRPIHAQSGLSPAAALAKKKEDMAAKKKKFQKKTKQVFLVPDEVRKLRREERYPWVIEDGAQQEVWVGMMEDATKSNTHALFMPDAGNVFKFVPAHRWYKFQKKPSHIIPTLEEAEKMMAQMQKNKDPERWLLHKRNGQAPSAATAAIFRAGAEGRTVTGASSLVHTSGQSLGPGGRRLKTVDSGMRGLFEQDDEEGVDTKRKREKEYGGEGDMDEMEYEDDFADDEEKMEPEGMDDDEAKELEERLKREYKNANKQRDGHIDESEDEEDEEHLTGAGKAMKKLVRKIDKNAGYDSDEEKNPYASSDEEEVEEEQPTQTVTEPPTSQETDKDKDAASRSASQTPAARPANKALQGSRTQPSSRATSRAGSPAPSLGGHGHSVVARRATSPKVPKLKNGGGGSRASSPLAPSRAGSPPATSASGNGAASPAGLSGSGSRAGSPQAPSPTSPTGSGMPKPSVKRKATDEATPVAGPSQPKHKKRKATSAGAGGSGSGAVATAPPGELRDEMLIEWLRNTPNATTRDCIQYFQPCLTDGAMKARFTALVREVAILKQGILVLKNSYREDSAAASTSVA